MSPPVRVAAKAQVPATMRSGTTRCSTGCRRRTPSTVSVEVATPSIRAPIRRSMRHRSTTSGSRGRVVDDGRAVGQRGGGEQVLGGPDARELEPDVRAGQPLRRLGHQEAVVDVHDGPELLQAVHVHVEAAGADRVAAGEGDVGGPAAGDERPQHADRGTHRPHQVVVGTVRGHRGHADRHHAGRRVVRDVAAEPAQQLGHDPDVDDVGDVHQRAGALGEQGGRHQLEDAVLRPRHAHRALEAGAADDPERFHGRRS